MPARHPFSMILLLGVLSACATGGAEDEYGRSHASYEDATAHRESSYRQVLQETEPLDPPLTGKGIVLVPDRSAIRAVIRAARPGHSEDYIQHNTDYMAVDSVMLPQLIERRNIFSEVEVFEGPAAPEAAPEGGYLVEYIFDIRGTHIFMTRGAEEGERIELPRPWVGAPNDEVAVRGILKEIETHVRAGAG